MTRKNRWKRNVFCSVAALGVPLMLLICSCAVDTLPQKQMQSKLKADTKIANGPWLDYTNNPIWAQRGNLRWTHGFVRWTEEKADTVVDLDFNLIQSGHWDHPKEIENMSHPPQPVTEYLKAHQKGFNWQPYIHSKPVYQSEIDKNPELKKALVILEDGKNHVSIGYETGRSFSDACWRKAEHLNWRIKVANRIKKAYPGVQSFFMDNASPRIQCYCPECRQAFRTLSQRLLGKEISLSENLKSEQYRALLRIFNIESANYFFSRFKKGTETLISPNFHFTVWHMAAIEKGISDIIFFEEGQNMAPHKSGAQLYNTFCYKSALSASQGKPVGIMLGIPGEIAETRALKRGRYPRGAPYVAEAYIFPEEHELALAEAVSCGGCYIPSWNIREQKIRLDNSPYSKAVLKVFKRHNRFMKKNRNSFQNALPSSNVALLYSTTTALGTSGRKKYPNTVNAESQAIIRSGIPYEVILERELSFSSLKNWDVIVLPHVRWLSLENCKILADYVKSGGSVILIGDFALKGPLGVPHKGKLPEQFQSDKVLQTVGKGKIWRVKSLKQLDSYEIKKNLKWASKTLKFSIPPTSKSLFVNAMHTKKYQTIHFVNYDFEFKKMEEKPIMSPGSDDGKRDAQTYLDNSSSRLKKLIYISDIKAFQKAYIQFHGGSYGMLFNMHVCINGKEIKSSKGRIFFGSPKWRELEIPYELLKQGENIIEFYVSGKTDHQSNYWFVSIDKDTNAGLSFFSDDKGATWDKTDLAQHDGIQQGEYMIRLSPKSILSKVYKEEDFDNKLIVHPVRNIALEIAENVPGAGKPGKLMTTEGTVIEVKPEKTKTGFKYNIPQVDIFAMLRIPREN